RRLRRNDTTAALRTGRHAKTAAPRTPPTPGEASRRTPSGELHRPAHSTTVPTPGYNTDGHRGVRRSPSRRPVLRPSQSPGRTWLGATGSKCTTAAGRGERDPASEEIRCRTRQPTTTIESTRGITSW